MPNIRKDLNIAGANLWYLVGLIDGDGSIRKWEHSSNKNEQWSLRIYSGSNKFLVWLDKRIQKHMKAYGKIHPKNSLYVLKFGKIAAKQILGACYYENCFGLRRKVRLAQQCCSSVVGWTRSKTVYN